MHPKDYQFANKLSSNCCCVCIPIYWLQIHHFQFCYLQINYLQEHVVYFSITVSKCMPEFPLSFPATVSPNPLNYSLNVCMIQTSKCVSILT